jgi:hypothetical protein
MQADQSVFLHGYILCHQEGWQIVTRTHLLPTIRHRQRVRICRPFDAPVVMLQEMKSLGRRNRITPLLNAAPPLGIWSRALAKVATSPDVLFHAIRNNPNLVGSAGRDDE